MKMTADRYGSHSIWAATANNKVAPSTGGTGTDAGGGALAGRVSATGRKRVKLGDLKLNIGVPRTRNEKTPIVVVTTGGTISAKGSLHSYTAGDLSGDDLMKGVERPSNTVVSTKTLLSIDSKDMTDVDWLKMTKFLASDDLGEKVVVTHGSDCMALSAFFLSLTLPKEVQQRRKIVLTGSMIPGNLEDDGGRDVHPDGPPNLRDALTVAKSKKGHGVLVVMDGKVLAPPYFDKCHTSSPHAFEAVNGPQAGRVLHGRTIPYDVAEDPNSGKFEIGDAKHLPYVAEINAGLGQTQENIRLQIKDAVKRGARGIVYNASGNGTINKQIEPYLAKKAANGVLIVRTTFTPKGEVNRDAHVKDTKLGFACAGNLPTAGHARVLAQVALAHEDHLQSKAAGKARQGVVDLNRVRKAFEAYQSPAHVKLANKADTVQHSPKPTSEKSSRRECGRAVATPLRPLLYGFAREPSVAAHLQDDHLSSGFRSVRPCPFSASSSPCTVGLWTASSTSPTRRQMTPRRARGRWVTARRRAAPECLF